MNFSVYKKRDVDTSKDPFSPEAFVFPEEDVSLTYDKFFSDTVYLTGRDYPVDTFFITTEVVRGKGITWWIDLDHHCWKLVER